MIRRFVLLIGVLTAGLRVTGDGASPWPMAVDETRAAPARWMEKGVLGARLLDDMENPANWSHHGFGEMTFTQERSRDGLQSVRLTSPAQSNQPNKVTGRPFGEAAARRNFDREDWSNFNRLSFWVYPHLPGFKVISLLVKFHNDGATKVPDAYNREGLHFVLLKPDQWNQVVWEIGHLARDQVTGLSLIYRLQGNEPGATNQVCYDFDRLELQQVREDQYESWTVQPGTIAFSHTGYQAGGPKSALAQDLQARHFDLINMDTGKIAATRPVRTVSTPIGTLQKLEFSDICEPGRYVIRAGAVVTPEFRIHADVWRDTLWKTINLFYCERCGYAVPGIHDICHRDWQARHGNQSMVINGGWHDAGDLSQGLVNTAEAVHAMLTLAEHLNQNTRLLRSWKDTEENKPRKSKAAPLLEAANAGNDPLAERLAEEAQWGLDWVLKTRFGDGARVTWATMDFWTDGVVGNADDTLGDVRNSPLDNFVGATTEAVAARFFKDRDATLAGRCLLAARRDWEFAVQKSNSPNLELASAAALASLELYRATAEKKFADKAIELAEIIVNSQQREYPAWPAPLTGFFYTSPRKERILHYSHRGHDQAPIVVLSALCEAFPEHRDWMRWYSAVVLHSEYLRKTAEYTEPYGLLPNGIYDLEENHEPWYQDQVQNGVPLSSRYFLRRFPVWRDFRGNHGTVLSQTKALSTAAQLRRNLDLSALGQMQLQWVVGRNPFAQSTMYGEGYDYAPQYTAMSGDMVGSLPVGIQTRANEDKPYWPAANCYNYKEVWVHPSSRWLWLMQDLNGPAVVWGVSRPKINRPVELMDIRNGCTYRTLADHQTGRFVVEIPEGEYRVTHGERSHSITVLPGSRRYLDLRETFVASLSQTTSESGRVMIELTVQGDGRHHFSLRSTNLDVDAVEQELELHPIKPQTLRWTGQMHNLREPWIGVVLPDGETGRRLDVWGGILR